MEEKRETKSVSIDRLFSFCVILVRFVLFRFHCLEPHKLLLLLHFFHMKTNISAPSFICVIKIIQMEFEFHSRCMSNIEKGKEETRKKDTQQSSFCSKAKKPRQQQQIVTHSNGYPLCRLFAFVKSSNHSAIFRSNCDSYFALELKVIATYTTYCMRPMKFFTRNTFVFQSNCIEVEIDSFCQEQTK